MANVLVTGMSVTGKSSAFVVLGRLGFPVVDTETAWDELPLLRATATHELDARQPLETVAELIATGQSVGA